MKYVYYFGKSGTEGKKELKSLLGGEGANLAEMSLIGLPVPAGFTITTEACAEFLKNQNPPSIPPLKKEGRKTPALSREGVGEGFGIEGLMEEVKLNLSKLEKDMGMSFGDAVNPLLVSV